MADPIFIPDEGLVQKLTSLMGQILSVASLRLYKNNKVPAAGDNATLYVECDFSGYARQTLNDLGAATVTGGVASTASGTHTFAHNGGAVSNTVYGWYMVDGAGKLIAASLNGAGPVTLSAAGQSYSVQVTFTDQRAP